MNKACDMQSEDIKDCKKSCKNKNNGTASGALYGLGFVGALIYFIQHAHSFTDGLMGILKAIIWPALVAYKLLEFFRF